MKKTPKNMIRKSTLDDEMDIDVLLAKSMLETTDVDTSRLQQRIMELTDGLPQATPPASVENTQRKPWSSAITNAFSTSTFSLPRLVPVVCVLIALVILLPSGNQQIVTQTATSATNIDSSEDVLLTDQELAAEGYEGLVWQELVLLEEEMAFATL